MLFYKFAAKRIESKLTKEESEDLLKVLTVSPGTRRIAEIAQVLRTYNSYLEFEDSFLCINHLTNKCAEGLLVSMENKDIEQKISNFFPMGNLKFYVSQIDEILSDEASTILGEAQRNNYLEKNAESLYDIRNDRFLRDIKYVFKLTEKLIMPDASKKHINKRVSKTLYSNTLLPEIARIFNSKKPKRYYGHPVHYMMLTVDRTYSYPIARNSLLESLFANNRLQSKRYWCINFDSYTKMPPEELERVFFLCKSSTLVISFTPSDNGEEDNYASADRHMVKLICEKIKKYQNEVLTLLVIPYKFQKAREMFYEYLSQISIVELREEYAKGEKAREYLKNLCKGIKTKGNERLFQTLDENKEYCAEELKGIFDRWYKKELQNNIFPEYKNIITNEEETIKQPPNSMAYAELTEMVGLESAKKVINQAIDYFRAQKIFSERGLKIDRPALSMAFLGNPGTAKTTVARLVAQIFYCEGIISNGNIVECSKADLVGPYVGWTSKMVEKRFEEAKGGVLFIDECYDLATEGAGGFGQEAINMITQMMENHRSDVLVIFAGYPDKMRDFLDKNPGLRSRISFHVNFEDYSVDELCQITHLVAEKKDLKISDGAMEKLRATYSAISQKKDFGNGRAVRNIIESAKMAMSSRLLTCNINALTDAEIVTIMPEDISVPTLSTLPEHKVVGF